ncbi:MAG: Bug family tripartite tricarboxylate transporter substrate binding protein [Hydrogenophaga sp.]|uniref:Bug family tripartite tricarboxylate transporter substrate binding protein n=1 Tax=Hydrogenophaga sp. TaxID=1904254 RepID=UPI003D0EC3AB
MKTSALRSLSLVTSLAVAAGVMLALPQTVAAQSGDFPNRPIKLMVATAPGGSADATARMIADNLSAAWGQPVVVENKVGANGMIATQTLAKSPPDGYTIYMSLSSIVQNLLLQPNPGYRMEELAPVSMVAILPIALAAGTQVPANNLGELIAMARQKPGAVSYGSYGVGSGAHIIGSVLNKKAGVDMTHIAYKGEANSFADLVSGQVTTAWGSVGFYANQLSGGKVKLLAVASPHRLKAFPNVPTLGEAGYPDANLPGFTGLFLPAGTPAAIVNKYSEAVKKAIATPDIQNKMVSFGYEPMTNAPEEFKKQLADEVLKWSTAIRENNIKLQ